MNRISRLRKSRNIKQSDLAKVLGVVQATLSNWETEKFDIDNNSLIRLANYFDVTTDYLLGNTDDSTPPFRAPETFQAIPMSPPNQEQKKASISDEAKEIAVLFDKADSRDKEAVRVLLGRYKSEIAEELNSNVDKKAI